MDKVRAGHLARFNTFHILLEQQQVRRNLQETDKRADNWLELTEKTFNFACYARYWFANAKSSQQKREILAANG
jgi:hypothetical protein